MGFGEAGAEIIGQNMKGSDSGVDALVPGQKVQAIFGFCGVREFSIATQVDKYSIVEFPFIERYKRKKAWIDTHYTAR